MGQERRKDEQGELKEKERRKKEGRGNYGMASGSRMSRIDDTVWIWLVDEEREERGKLIRRVDMW